MEETLLKCFGVAVTEADWRVLGGIETAVGWLEANRLEQVWLAKTENTEEQLWDYEHGVRELQTIKRLPESARWRQELADKLKIDYPNLKPKSATVVDSGKQLVVLRWNERVSLEVKLAEAPKDKVPEPAVLQKVRPSDALSALLEQGRRIQRRMPWMDRRNHAATKPHEADSERA